MPTVILSARQSICYIRVFQGRLKMGLKDELVVANDPDKEVNIKYSVSLFW